MFQTMNLRTLALIVFALVLLALFAGAASAQTAPPDVKNPTVVEWVASADHAASDSYELDIVKPDGTTLQTLNMGKPAPDANQVCRATLNIQPIAFAKGYSTRLRAKAGTAVSDDTLGLNKFERAPGPPSKLIAK